MDNRDHYYFLREGEKSSLTGKNTKTRGSKPLVLENLTLVFSFFRIYIIRTFTSIKLDLF